VRRRLTALAFIVAWIVATIWVIDTLLPPEPWRYGVVALVGLVNGATVLNPWYDRLLRRG
jgi:hypothetical protein